MCHIQLNLLSLTHAHTYTLSSLHRSRFLLIIPELSSCCALVWLILYFPQQRALTQVETRAVSPPFLYCICTSLSATFDHPGRSFNSKSCIVHLYHWTNCEESAFHCFIYWKLCFSMYVITLVISLLFTLLQSSLLSFSCLGPLAINYWIVFCKCELKRAFSLEDPSR